MSRRFRVGYTVEARSVRASLRDVSLGQHALVERVLENLSVAPSIGVYDPEVGAWWANAGGGARVRYDFDERTREVLILEIRVRAAGQSVEARWWDDEARLAI